MQPESFSQPYSGTYLQRDSRYSGPLCRQAPDARIAVTEGHIGWADIIVLMEKSHLNRLRRKFPETLQAKRTVTLLITDEYEYMQPDLSDELQAKVSRYVVLPHPGRDV